MDAKEIKCCLKDAREAIRNKEYKDAAKQCKTVLAADPHNYNALVFLGVTAEGLEQPDQALKAYKRAAQEQPDQLLAWQGISSMLEKNPTLITAEESIEVFTKLVSLHASDVSKQVPQLHKLYDIYIKEDQKDKALQTIDQLLCVEKDKEKRVKPLCSLITLISPTSPNFSKEQFSKYESSLREVIYAPENLLTDRDAYIRLLLLFVSQTKLQALQSTCESLSQDFPTLPALLEFHLRLILDQNIGEGCPSQAVCESVKKLTMELASVQDTNPMIKVGQAFSELQNRNFILAKDLLADIPEDLISGQYFLSQVCLHLHFGAKCLEACNKGVAACSKKEHILCAPVGHVCSLFELAKAEAYMESGTEDAQANALALLEEVQERMPTEAFLIKAYIFLDQGKVSEAQDCVNYLPGEALSVRTLQAKILLEKKAYERALIMLQGVVKEDPQDARATLLLGIVLWELRESNSVDNVKQECFTTLLKAAKLDPYNHRGFLYIGYFYKQIQQDKGKAKKCFQKAFDLHPGDNESGAALVETLLELGEEDQALKVLQKVTAMAPAGCAKWAWLRLGLHQIRHEDPSTAIISLQCALRADPEDKHVWECLAEAYLQRGSLTAALKAFTKASELNPESVYCLFQIASIKHILGLAAEAIEEYKTVLEKSSNYVPALKGISESLIQLAKQNLKHCLDGLAQSNFEEAIVNLTRAASQRPDMSCLWKLMGDACSLVSCLAADAFCVPSKLVGKQMNDQNKEVKTEVSKMELLQTGARCYNQALKIMPESGSLWHDLGVNLYLQSEHCHSCDSRSASGDGPVLVNRAAQVMRKAISLEPKEWKHWNSLGVIVCSKLFHKPALAQHCFIKAIECESSNAVAWTNLGSLYLDKEEVKLAHDAFTSAQSTDPTYTACWIGQALIAEIVGHEEAMDLFRHTTELGFHVGSAVSYGQWVLSMLGDSSKRDSDLFRFCIQQMAALPAASDALVRYTTRVKNDAIALNMQGLLFEYQGLLRSSAEAFSKALAVPDKENGRQEDTNKIKLSLARVLCKQKQFAKSVEQYEQCDVHGNVEHLCMFGLALLRSGRLEESRKLYHVVLELAQEGPAQSQIHTALGMVAFMQGDLPAAKSYLFDGFQTSQPSLHGLLALCSLGLLQGDTTLASAVLDELYKRELAAPCRKDTLFLEFYKHLVEGDRHAGEARLKDYLESNSTDPSVWSLLASVTLRTSKSNGSVVTECARTAITHETDAAKNGKQKMLQSLGQLSAAHHSRLDSDGNALKNAQKAFHLNPGCSSSLAALACAVHAEAEIRLALHGNTNLLNVEESLLQIALSNHLSNQMQVWCLQQLVINSVLRDNIDQAKSFLKQLQEQHSQSTDVVLFQQVILNLLSGKSGEKLNDVAVADGFHWVSFLVNCSLRGNEKRCEENISCLQQAMDNSKNKKGAHDRQALLERTSFESYKFLLESGNSSVASTFENAAKSLKDKELASPIVSLLQALYTLRSTPENKRLAKHHLATALDQINATVEVGFLSSVLRQKLVSLLWDSKKETDQQMVKGLLEDAAAKHDTDTAEHYRKLMSGKD